MTQTQPRKKKSLKIPILVKITILFIVAGILGFLVVRMLSRKARIESAVDIGGERSLYACLMASQFLDLFDKNDLLIEGSINNWSQDESPEFQQLLTVFRERYFPVICFTMEIKYLYFYTVDENQVRHHILISARDADEDKKMNETAGYGTTNDDPLDENEILALKGDYSNPYATYSNSYGSVCASVIPYFDHSGKLTALIGADCDLGEIVLTFEKQEKSRNTMISAMFFLMMFLGGILLHFIVTSPARKLSKEMRRFSENPNIELSKRKVLVRDEVTEMEHSFRVMARNIREYIGNIETLTREKAVADVQMETAKKIQMGMVPPSMEHEGDCFSFAASMQPALSVGGDFYDALKLTSGEFAVVIGDVSGKGIGAALFMAMTRRIIHEKLMQNKRVSEVLTEANREICLENPEGFFATVIAAIYDPKTGKLTLSNAGHNPPLMVGKDSVREITVDPGMVLGLFDDSEYIEEDIMIPSGEGVFLYTDGATEAVNPKREPYGLEKLIEELTLAEHTAKGMVDRIRESVIGFEGEAGFFDDLTLMALLRAEIPESTVPQEDIMKDSGIKMELKVSLNDLDKMKEEFFQKFEMSEDRKKEIYLVLEEWFANVVSYSGATKIDLEMFVSGDEFTAVFTDDGTPFNVVNHVPEDKEFEDFDLGGMGIGLIRDLTKHLSWERVGDCNKVTMIFAMEQK